MIQTDLSWMICFRGRKNYQRTFENQRRTIKRSRESGFLLARYLLWSVYPFALPPPRWEEFYSNLNFFKAQTSCYLFELFLCSTPYFRICYRNRASLEISCRGFFRTSSHLYYFIDFSLLFFENFRNFSLHIRSPPLLFCCPSITKQSGGSIWLL